jgi:hypothetical protein
MPTFNGPARFTIEHEDKTYTCYLNSFNFDIQSQETYYDLYYPQGLSRDIALNAKIDGSVKCVIRPKEEYKVYVKIKRHDEPLGGSEPYYKYNFKVNGPHGESNVFTYYQLQSLMNSDKVEQEYLEKCKEECIREYKRKNDRLKSNEWIEL